ncbi:MAG: histidine kinase N-terminal 7TM domain-containing protein [Caldilineaceae bacterium]
MMAQFLNWHFTLLQIPVLITLFMCIALALYVRRQQPSPLGQALFYAAVACGAWSLFRLFIYLSVDIDVKRWWDKVEYFAIVSVPLTTLALALHYTGRGHWVTRRTLSVAFVIPLTTICLLWTTEQHGLVWATQSVADTPFGPMTYYTYGPWFWVHTGYSYAVILSGSVLILLHLFQTPLVYRWQAVNIVLAVFAPLLANLGFITRMQPAWLDFTPSAFTITMALLTWDVFRLQLLNVVPIARRVIFDTLGDALIVLTHENRVADLNPATIEIFKLQGRRPLGSDVRKLFSFWPEFVEYCITQSGEYEMSLECERQGRRWFQVQVETIRAVGGKPSGKIVLLHDITQQKQNEQALAVARDEAMAADRLKTQLLAKVSHELRTPLSVIMSYAELIRSSNQYQQPEKRLAAVTTILDYTRFLTKLVDDLLDTAQLDAGKMRLKSEPFSPAALIEQVCQQNYEDAEQKVLILSTWVDPVLPLRLYGDQDRLLQILNNLVSNAIKFTDAGKIEVKLCAASATQWKIQVTDSGRGIPPELQSTIFEPFQQLETSAAGKRKGYGLGLSIVRQLSEQMCGEVQIKSEIGYGTTFTVLLPLQTEAAIG